MVHALKGNVRAYLMASIGKEKKYVMEITQAQAPKYHELVIGLQQELEEQMLGQTLAQVKTWAKQRKHELLNI